MQNIEGNVRNLEELLTGDALTIDYYQREYKWERKQLRDLVDDLHGQFKQTWDPSKSDILLDDLSKYFLGSIVISKSEGIRSLVDGQQRITTLTLILIHLSHLLESHPQKLDTVRELIYKERPNKRELKLNVPERSECMNAILDNIPFDTEGETESIKNLIDRHDDIVEIFSNIDMKEDELYMFTWWIIQNVKIIEIITQDDEDAYFIFETMNDRGLSLTPTDMLRGYLLSGIKNERSRQDADKKIKEYLQKFGEYGKNTAADFFRAWLRSQYAKNIRQHSKNATPEDFDKIGTEYHRWIQRAPDLDFNESNQFYEFITQDMSFFAKLYIEILNASTKLISGSESIKYNYDSGFTQHHIYFSGVSPNDSVDIARKKIRVVADFIDIWLNRRAWNYKSNGYSTILYTLFSLSVEIRHQSIDKIGHILKSHLKKEYDEVNFDTPVQLNQRNKKSIHRQLARITDWLEIQSDRAGNYENYIVRSGAKSYQIEHIWANKYERFSNKFDHLNDFELFRNKIGGLLLMPGKINASLGDKPYREKLHKYAQENILSKSLDENFYKNNPAFKKMIKKYKLPFRSHSKFTENDLNDRSMLYCEIAKLIWSDDRILN